MDKRDDLFQSKVLLKSNFYKESGFHCSVVLKELFSLKFFGKNLYQTLSAKSKELSFKKNTAYRFLNAGHFNWEKMLLMFTTQLISTLDRLTGSDRQSVLIRYSVATGARKLR